MVEKDKDHMRQKFIWMAPAACESRCKLIIRAIVLVALAIEIIVGLGTFSFKDQPIKVRLEVYARHSRRSPTNSRN